MSAHGARAHAGLRPGVAAGTAAGCVSDARMATRHLHQQGGFTLLEVIAAIMLLAIAFTAMMKVAGASIALTQNAATRSAAAMWARSKLDSEFVTTPLQPGRTAGQFDGQFAWRLAVTPWNQSGTAAADSTLQLYQLDLEVVWGPSGHPRSAHFRTLRLAGIPTGTGQTAGRQP